MRNYLFSITVHIILLILFMSWWMTDSEPDIPFDHVVIVDFDNVNEVERIETKQDVRVTKQPVTRDVQKSVSSEQQKSDRSPAEPKKASEQRKETLQTSQKPTELPKKSEVKSTETAKEIVPNSIVPKDDLEKKITPEEAKHLEVKNSFKSLLDRSFKIASSSDSEHSNDSDNQIKNGEYSSSPPAVSMNGDLSKRKVLKVPQIVDDSQKQGKAVIKICVDASGKVVSADYTQMGSTTSDQHLVSLAVEGAYQYLFSPSNIKLECGRVIIDFKLK